MCGISPATKDKIHFVDACFTPTSAGSMLIGMDDDGIPYDVAMPEIVAYLNANYEIETNIGAFDLMRRKN